MNKEQTYIVYYKNADGDIKDFNRFGVKQCRANEKKILTAVKKYLKNDLVRWSMDRDKIVTVELWMTDASGNKLTISPAWSEKYSEMLAA